jgi:Reverse transcriptase (RNA-dependent DNA polymerase)/Endonuclease-reverse transcriptase
LERLVAGAAEFLFDFDIFAVWDTRSNPDLPYLFQPDFTVFQKQEVANTPGHGACVFVSQRIKQACRFLGYHKDIPLAWLQLHTNTYIAFIYAQPALLGSLQQNTNFLAMLHADISKYQELGHVVVIGDFNAKIGDLPDAGTSQRSCTIPTVNEFGELLMHMAANSGLLTSTGRLDTSQPSFVNSRGCSRIDHAFFDSDIFPHVRDWQVVQNRYGSDHHPLAFALSLTHDISKSSPPQPRMRWDHSQQQEFAAHISQRTADIQVIESLLEQSDLTGADVALRQLLYSSAMACGMIVKHEHGRRGSMHKLPLSTEAMRVRAQVAAYRRNGVKVPEQLRAVWKQHVKSARKLCATRTHVRMMACLRSHLRKFWRQYKRAFGSTDCVRFVSEWLHHFEGKFSGTQHRAPSTHIPASIDQSEACPLMQPVTADEVMHAFRKLGTNKAVGFDALPAEFLTKASPAGTDASAFHRMFANMCNLVIQRGEMPHDWKVKVLTPVHKKGPRDCMDNYRPIAVATTFYRVFTAIFGARLSEYLQTDGSTMLLDSQFGFRKGLSTDHAHFVLVTCCQTALVNNQPVALVKLDITKAYDTVLRTLLWASMENAGLPLQFVNLMKMLYHDSAYVVRANGEVSHEFLSDIGLQQGCALSPQSYNLYLCDLLKEIEARCRHVGVNLYGLHCVQVNYADDITGIVALEHVGMFLQVVEEVLAKKNQLLQRTKCEALVISREPCQFQDLHGIPVVPRLKILGLFYTNDMCMGVNIDTRRATGSAKNILHISRLHRYGCSRNLQICSMMLDGDVRPTLLFGACIWGAHQLSYIDPMRHPLQAPYSVLQRYMLGQPHSTAHWIVSKLTGHMPIQHWVIRDFCRTWNRLIATADSNQLIRHALLMQKRMLRGNQSCWLKSWHHALARLVTSDSVCVALRFGHAIQEKVVLHSLESWYDSILRNMGDPTQSNCPHRRIAFTTHMLAGLSCKWDTVPRCMKWNLPTDVAASWWSLLAANAALPVRAYQLAQFQFRDKLCRKCCLGVPADETHVLLHCHATNAVRVGFGQKLLFPTGPLSHFLRTNTSRWLAFFVHAVLRVYRAAPDISYEQYPLSVLQVLIRVYGAEPI